MSSSDSDIVTRRRPIRGMPQPELPEPPEPPAATTAAALTVLAGGSGPDTPATAGASSPAAPADAIDAARSEEAAGGTAELGAAAAAVEATVAAEDGRKSTGHADEGHAAAAKRRRKPTAQAARVAPARDERRDPRLFRMYETLFNHMDGLVRDLQGDGYRTDRTELLHALMYAHLPETAADARDLVRRFRADQPD